MILQDWSLHSLQKIINAVDVVVGQIKALDVGLGGSSVSQSEPTLGPIYQMKV